MTTRLQAGPDGMAARAQVAGRLDAIALRTAWTSGEAFYRALAQSLAGAIGVPCTFITEFRERQCVARPLAFWYQDHFTPAGDYALAGTPCATVLDGGVAIIVDRILSRFPEDREALEALRAESYVAAPVIDAQGTVIGHVAAIDQRTRRWDDSEIAVLWAIGERIAGEIERGRRAHAESATAASSGLQEMLATVRHDLRTPLNGILGYTQLLARDPALSERSLQATRQIQACGEQLLALFDALGEAPTSGHGSPDSTSAPRTSSPPPSEAAEPPLPAGLHAQLLESATRGDVNALGRGLDELERHGTHPELVSVLRTFAADFDMRAIRDQVRRHASALV